MTMKMLRQSCQFVFVILAIAVLTPLLMLYIAGEYVVEGCSLARQAWRECGKLTAIVLLVLGVSAASAGSVSLAWDASQSPGITNYVLYAGTNNPATNATHLVKVNAGTNLTVRVEGLTPPTTWFFWATAQKGGLESDRSNVVQAQVPFPPANSRVLVVQAGVNLTNGFTDVGFFRLYFPANAP